MTQVDIVACDFVYGYIIVCIDEECIEYQDEQGRGRDER